MWEAELLYVTLQLAHHAPEAAIDMERLLAALLLHHSPAVRKSAAAATARLVSASPELAGRLLAALQYWLQNMAALGQLADPAAGQEEAGLPDSVTSRRLSDALLSIVAALQCVLCHSGCTICA